MNRQECLLFYMNLVDTVFPTELNNLVKQTIPEACKDSLIKSIKSQINSPDIPIERSEYELMVQELEAGVYDKEIAAWLGLI